METIAVFVSILIWITGSTMVFGAAAGLTAREKGG